MSGYYDSKLAAERLKQCYDLASSRVKQYLKAEIDFVLSRVRPGDEVLDVGCGYGRVIPELAKEAGRVMGIDSSVGSLVMAREFLSDAVNVDLACMDASRLAFTDGSFDCLVCIQNGISAFHVDRGQLIGELVRVTRPGGRVLLSTYSEKFWDDRLKWFELQAGAGLLGEIDWDRTGEGEIVCKDGFTASTVTHDEFECLARSTGFNFSVEEVDESSLFCVLTC